MKSTLTIKDLSATKELDGKAMSAVRGGLGDQSNATGQSNFQQMFAPVSVANGASFSGGPVIFQVDSNPIQTATNDSTSSNDKGAWLYGISREYM
jgi:hypothetical protein